MQDTQLIEERVPFEKLCPDWDEQIKDHGEFISLKSTTFTTVRDGTEGKTREHSLSNGASCLVGEAFCLV